MVLGRRHRPPGGLGLERLDPRPFRKRGLLLVRRPISIALGLIDFDHATAMTIDDCPLTLNSIAHSISPVFKEPTSRQRPPILGSAAARRRYIIPQLNGYFNPVIWVLGYRFRGEGHARVAARLRPFAAQEADPGRLRLGPAGHLRPGPDLRRRRGLRPGRIALAVRD